MTQAQVRAAAAAAVTATGAVRCSPYFKITGTPCAYIVRRERDPRMVLDAGKAEYRFSVIVLQSRADDLASLKRVDALTEQSGNGSIKYRLESDSTLGALVDYGQVSNIGGEEVAEISGVEYIVSTVDFEVVF